VDNERDQKILVGPSRLLHSRKRKRRETNKKGERTNGTGGNKVETNRRVENAAVPKKARVRNVVMRESRLVVEVGTIRPLAIVAMAVMIRAVDVAASLKVHMGTGRNDAMTIQVRVLMIVRKVVNASDVQKRKALAGG
jgi:hypothetical protein